MKKYLLKEGSGLLRLASMWPVVDAKCYLNIECYFAEHYTAVLFC